MDNNTGLKRLNKLGKNYILGRVFKLHPFRQYFNFVNRISYRRSVWAGPQNTKKDKRMHRCFKRSIKNFMNQELKKQLEDE